MARTTPVLLGALAGLAIAVAAAVVVGSAVDPDRVGILDVEPGDCFTLPNDENLTELDVIELQDCDEPHDAEVVAVGDLNPAGGVEYPDDELLFDLVDVACGDPRRFFPDGFGLLPVAPNERAWNGRDGRYVCVAVSLGEGRVTGRRIGVGSTPIDGEESTSR